MIHKLFCREAKLNFSAISCQAKEKDNGKLLQFMRIPALDRKKGKKSFDYVLWDLGSTDNYVCQTHAENMGLKKE